MRTRRQNIQLELALEPVAKGEARSPDTQGTEARTAHAEPERPAAGQQPLMEAVVEPPARPRIRRRRPCRLTPSNRRVRTRTHGGVGGEEPRGSPLSRLRYGPAGDSAPRLRLKAAGMTERFPLYLNVGNPQRALDVAKVGVEHEPDNEHCQNLILKLDS